MTNQPANHPSDGMLLGAMDDELAPQRADDVQAHLAACDACRRRSQQLASVSRELAFDARGDSEEDALRTAALRSRLAATMSAELSPRSRVSLSSAATVAAAVVVAAMLGRAVMQQSVAPQSDTSVASIEPAARPDKALTPGAVQPVTVAELCAGRLPPRTQVPEDVRRAILRDYQMEQVNADEYELDYLITPELGGAADRRNLWPERYGSRVWNARVKDDLERLLPQLVCAGSLDLATAQQDIATDWIAAYRKYFHTDRPIQVRAGRDTKEDRDRDDPKLMSLATPAAVYPWK